MKAGIRCSQKHRIGQKRIPAFAQVSVEQNDRRNLNIE
ncbi:Uncharacterized protein dnm_064200 [Desulfonema magnum]|uniref:Uncharacterized protein n=1 Tax=Desulfonema magnum TaxID=45655 RepID=A0A975GQX8_9BACT|nr:Uncharacterized protein dnm_064200 [Desulfonema magnum]